MPDNQEQIFSGPGETQFTPEDQAPLMSSELSSLEQDLVDYVFDLQDRIDRSAYRRAKIEEITKARRDYNQIVEKKQKDWPWKNASCLNLPLTTIAVDNVVPRMFGALAGKGDEVCHFEDVGQQNPEVEELQSWFNDELINRVQIRKAIRNFVERITLDGTVYVAVDYDREEELRRDFVYEQVPIVDPATGLPISAQTGMPIQSMDEDLVIAMQDQIKIDPQTGDAMTEDVVDVVHEGAISEILEFEDVFIPDNIENWEDAPVIRRVNIPYHKLRDYQARGVVGYVGIDDSLVNDSVDALDNATSLDANQKDDSPIVIGRRVVPCIEASLKWDFQRKYDRDQGKFVGEEKIVVLIAIQSRKLIRLCLQRDLEFFNKKLVRRLRLFTEAGKSYGTGLPAKLSQVQTGASDTFNLILNSAFVCMMPWYFYGQGSGLDKELEIYPGAGIPVVDANQVKFPSFSVNPSQYIPFINMFVSMFERISSIADVQVGRSQEITGNRAQTATATMMQVQEANIKHTYTANMIQEEFADMLGVIYDLYYQHIPIEAVWDQEGKLKFPSKTMMRQKRKFVLTGTTDTSNKFIERSEAETLFSQLGGDPVVDHSKLVLDILRTYGKEDPEAYIDPTINQILQIYAQNPQEVQMFFQQFVGQMMAAAQQEQGATNDKKAPGGHGS